MKLIKVEVYGFKLFVEFIILYFNGGVVGIVGFNGFGKLNINDVIKWVLGERSVKEFWGDNMDDVIFVGFKIVKFMDKVVVIFIFDNKDG